MVVDLTEMVSKMRDEVKQPLVGEHGFLRNRLGERCRQFAVIDLVEALDDRRGCRVDLAKDLRTAHLTSRELGISIANIACAAKLRADEVLEVTAEMQRQI